MHWMNENDAANHTIRISISEINILCFDFNVFSLLFCSWSVTWNIACAHFTQFMCLWFQKHALYWKTHKKIVQPTAFHFNYSFFSFFGYMAFKQSLAECKLNAFSKTTDFENEMWKLLRFITKNSNDNRKLFHIFIWAIFFPYFHLPLVQHFFCIIVAGMAGSDGAGMVINA